MVMLMLPDAGEMSVLCLPAVVARCQAAACTEAGSERVHIAVATRQKSTARRLVSSMFLEDTYQMLFTSSDAVTFHPRSGAIVV
jgi:hypothetical protein